MKKIIAVVSLATTLLAGVFALDKNIANNEKVENVEAITTVSEFKGPKIYVVGDSTFSAFADKYYYPRYGIGTKLQDYLLEDKVHVENLAMSGRSSKSFNIEENYDTLKANIKKGDFLIIGFGHNDEKAEEDRYTNPNGTKDDKGSFKRSLYKWYIKVAQDAGATPILCTPIVRRAPGKPYEGQYVHIVNDSGEFQGGDYPKAIRELAAECKIPLVDNTAYTKELYEKLTDEGTIKLHAWLGHKPASVDNTHLNTYGASVLAYHTVLEIAKQNKKFAKFVKKGIAEPKEEEVLVKNPDFIIPVYKTFEPSMASSNFQTTAPWFGTVFGDCGGAGKIADPELYEIVEDGNKVSIHAGSKDAKIAAGKISSSSDGIAFYFQQIPADKDFTFTAKMKVNKFANNNQVAFGIMVRDDVYIDRYDSTINTNYAAAGCISVKNEKSASSFMRKDLTMVQTPSTVGKPQAGETYELKITKTGSKLVCQFANDEPAEYELNLKETDSDFVYAGCFASRAAFVEFSDIAIK